MLICLFLLTFLCRWLHLAHHNEGGSMWDLMDFLNRHPKEDRRALRRAFYAELRLFDPQDEDAPPTRTTVTELIVIDRMVRGRHKEDRRIETIHLAIHEYLKSLETHRRPTKSDEEFLRNRPVTTEQWFTLWREETCHDRGRPDLRDQAQRYFCHQFIQNLELLPKTEHANAQRILDDAELTLFELIELEPGFRSMHWGASDRIATKLRERVRDIVRQHEHRWQDRLGGRILSSPCGQLARNPLQTAFRGRSRGE